MQNVYAFAWGYDAVGNRRWQNRLGRQSYFAYDATNTLKREKRGQAPAVKTKINPTGPSPDLRKLLGWQG